ncbi:MAG: hypothetical protein NTW55_05935 [Planctomycetota bacterium]|nr:hypothetical protein [Planctomycetota bacterium]
MKIYFRKLRKHIVWRVFVRIMVCIWGITIIASLYSDVIKPIFFPTKVIKREIEFKELLSLFVGENDWRTGASIDSPFEWETDGIFGDVPSGEFFKRFQYARHGETVVLINGEPIHEELGKNIHPASWAIVMYGEYTDSYDCVLFLGSGTGTDARPDIMGYLSEYTELKKEHPESGGTFIGKLYKLALPGKEPCWLVESWSIGNHLWSCDFMLFPEIGSYEVANEYLGSLL